METDKSKQLKLRLITSDDQLHRYLLDRSIMFSNRGNRVVKLPRLPSIDENAKLPPQQIK